MFFSRKPLTLPTAEEALPGRATPIPTADAHFVSGRDLTAVPTGMEVVDFGLGCFWGAERLFWQVPGVWATSVGYQGGHTPNPTYEEVCSGRTGHAETVRVVYDPARVSFDTLLQIFWEAHDPTQGMRQHNDIGTQYRSAIYTHTPEQAARAAQSLADYQRALSQAGRGSITTELAAAPTYYPAETYHQQYLAKNPAGYCGLAGTGVSCPIPSPMPA